MTSIHPANPKPPTRIVVCRQPVHVVPDPCGNDNDDGARGTMAHSYAFAPSHELPTIDCAKVVKEMVLGPRELRWYNALIRGLGNRTLITAYALGSVASWGLPFFDHAVGQWIALAAALLQVVSLVGGFMRLRYDVTRLVLRTYEFWYFTLTNVTAMMLLCCQVADLRATVLVVILFLYEHALLIDGNYRGVRVTIVSSVVGAIVLMILVAYAGLGLLRDTRELVLVAYGQWTLEATDVVVNGATTAVVVLLRNAYRKHLAIAHLTRDEAVVRCITYRARLRLVRVDPARAVIDGGGNAVQAKRQPPQSPHTATSATDAADTADDSSANDAGASSRCVLSKLRLVPSTRVFRANDLLWLRQTGIATCTPLRLAMGYVGAITTVLAMTLPRHHRSELPVAVIGIGATLLYCLPCVARHNRGLLRHILWSFDFLFVGCQVLVAHLVVAFLIEWSWRCLIVAASWLWMYWVLTLDLLTPIVKRRLGISMRLAALVLGLQILGQVFLCLELVFLRRWDIADRVLVDFAVGHRTVAVRAIPFLLSRLFTMFWWSWRLLFRLWRRGEDELLMIHAAVEYDDYDSQRRLLENAKHANHR